ncbi:MAG: hypothetical protein GEU86_05200 [Actinophytocola sp.]|nr:hypothetical protein [Actinophytocola sp.]
MSTPLPELPSDSAIEVTAEAITTDVSGQLLLVLPFRMPEGASRGRRYRLRCGTVQVVRVIFRLHDRTACRPADTANAGERITVSLRAIPAKRRRGIPTDVQAALRDAELDLEGLSEAQVQHLLLMVTEARDPAIRAERIRIAVQAARAAT